MKTAIVIVVIVILGILLYWMFGVNRVETPVTTETTTTTTTTNTPATNGVTPSPSPTTTGTTLNAKVGQTMTFNGVTGSITGVAEDSRCPTDVQCIQAGTVKVKGHFSVGTVSQDVTLGLNETFAFGGHSVTFIKVTPDKVSTKTISPSDYTFTFLVK